MSFSESLTDIVSENRNQLLGVHSSWVRVRLGDVVEIQNGFPFASERFSSSPTGMPLIRIRDILRNSTETYFEGEYPREFIVEPGSLLVGMDGDFNSAIWHGEPGLLNQRCCKLRAISNDLDSRFLAYCLPGYLAAINAHTSAITVKHLSSRTVSDIPLPLPPIGEQNRIADTLDELLSDLDAGVAALARLRAKLKHYRAAVLKAAVEGSLTAQWRREHPATETADVLLTRILAERRRRWEQAQLAKFEKSGKAPPKDWKAKYVEPISPDTADLPTLPEQWCWASLDQVCEIQGGLQKQPGRSPREHHFPYLRVANVHRGFVDLTELKRFELTEAERLRHRLETGDLLVVEGNGSKTEIGRCAIWKGEIEDCVHQNHIIRVRLIDGIAPAFADQFLNSPTGQLTIQSIASSTSGLYTLSVAKIAKFPLAVPPRSEQAAIIETVEAQLSVIDHLERDLDARLKSAQSLRQSILRHAFTGQLVPQDPNDEPASELLKRIAAEREERARLLRASKQTKPKTRAPRAATKKK